jgi:NAD/NADP transhydrogenase alpha subunit
MLASADDRTSADVTATEQAKMKQEAAAKKASYAKMTPEEKAAAKKASNAEHQKYQDSIIKQTQIPGESRNMAINKSAAASKAGPTPQRDYINTPEAEQKLMKNKGQ